MAALTLTPADVRWISGGYGNGIAGEALTQGQPIYLSSSKFYRCDANDGVAKSVCVGIVLTPAGTDEDFIYAKPGAVVDVGATLTVGTAYYVSATVGSIDDAVASASYVSLLGVAIAAGELQFSPIITLVQKP